MSSVGEVKVNKMFRVGEKRAHGSKEVMSGVPLSVGMEELVE